MGMIAFGRTDRIFEPNSNQAGMCTFVPRDRVEHMTITPKAAFISGALAIGATSLISINFEPPLRSLLDLNHFPSMLRGTFDVARASNWPTSATFSFALAYLFGLAIAIYAKINTDPIDFAKSTGKSASSIRLSKLMLLCVLGASLLSTSSNIRYGNPHALPSLSSPIALLTWCEGIYILTFISALLTITSIKKSNSR